MDSIQDSVAKELQFGWISFYEAMADKLLTYKDRRSELVAILHSLAEKTEEFPNLKDKFADGSSGPLKDICPFTVMAMFNYGGDNKRKNIMKVLSDSLGIIEPVPDGLDGIPSLVPSNAWFFPYEEERQLDDIDNLWDLFKRALDLATADNTKARSAFTEAFDNAIKVKYSKWNITMGLFWIRANTL